MINQGLLKELFVYDDATGRLLNRKNRGGRSYAGMPAGHLHTRGYRHVVVNGKVCKEHILIWVYLHGEIPVGFQVDHIDRDRANNKMCNLRLCTAFENQHNRCKNKNNTSGFKGVYVTPSGKYVAEIMSNRKRYRLGTFETKEAAARAWNEASKTHHGEYGKLNDV